MSRKCSCGTYPIFNMPGQTKGVCCSKCKTDEMIDVRSKRCPCGSLSPIFNTPGQTKGMCCSKCKTDDMIDVVSKRCSCGKISSFNVPGQKKGVCCSKCKTDEMIDVVSKKCRCGKIPKFNVPGESNGVCCTKCKTDCMINVKDGRCSCGKRPVYNVLGESKGVCCSGCKTGEMIDVVNKICSGYNAKCPVRTYIGNGHKYCMSCDPNDERRKRYKLYEEAFFDYVKDKINVHKREFHVFFDQNETSKKFARVDGIVIGDGIIVCIEVDENGHLDYECDEHRMHLVNGELLQLYPKHNIAWVRVNPSVKSTKIRDKRFDDVIKSVNDILDTKNTELVYIGFA